MARHPNAQWLFRIGPPVAWVLCGATASAEESLEFVAEHLPEIAMDNRYASLPLWGGASVLPEDDAALDRWHAQLSVAYSVTRAGTLELRGPMLAAGLHRKVGTRSVLSAFALYDPQALSSGLERRPLEMLSVSHVPLALPAAAQFGSLDGRSTHEGAGIAFGRAADWRLMGHVAWRFGVIYERVVLRRYELDYRILDGPSAGTTGTVDYSATYSHVTPFAGIAWPREHAVWAFTPHVQIAMPTPRRGVAGRITGPGFELSGDTKANGKGAHFGDPSLTIGWDVTYRPWNLTVDLGSAVSQALLERGIHKGADRNLMMSLAWSH